MGSGGKVGVFLREVLVPEHNECWLFVVTWCLGKFRYGWSGDGNRIYQILLRKGYISFGKASTSVWASQGYLISYFDLVTFDCPDK